MIRPLGESFAPTSAADDEARKPNPAEQAIQVLSMRLPRVKGARSISPLVGEPGSAARRETPGGYAPDSAVLQTLMRAQAPTGTSDAMSAPQGSMPGASSDGASDPMAAALAGLGGGMMNAAPQPFGQSAPPRLPGMPSPAPPPPPVIVPGANPSLPVDPTPIPDLIPTPQPQVPLPDYKKPTGPPPIVNLPAPTPAPMPAPMPSPGPQGPEAGMDPRLLKAIQDLFGGREAR